jgi:hypothetical protein
MSVLEPVHFVWTRPALSLSVIPAFAGMTLS